MKWDSQTQQWVIGGAIVIVLAVAAWWLFTSAPKDAGTDTPVATTTQSTSTATTTSERPSVSLNTGEDVLVDDQPAGDSVIVMEAALSRVSWLAVRDDMRIYGAARVTPPVGGGTMTDISIPLLRNTESGKTYKVVVYADDGDNMFDFKKDALVTGLDDTFSATNGD